MLADVSGWGAWPILVGSVSVVLAAATASHAVLNRRDPRAALLWVGLAWLSPIVGACTYFLFGINRVKRRAARLRREVQTVVTTPESSPVTPESLARRLPDQLGHLESLQRVAETVLVRPLLPGNRFRVLENGDAAYPAMLAAIDAAQRSVALASYIFDRDAVGERFVDSLAAAKHRGVAVRVLVDDIGSRYSFPRVTTLLRRAGVPEARFHHRAWFLPSGTVNLRNHRKLLVVDGRLGFTGGANISADNVAADGRDRRVRDLHFEVEGPVVAALQEVFTEDWAFTTGEQLAGEPWFPPLEEIGQSFARGIADGPDEDLDKLRWCLLGAVTAAQRSISIVTPYFLPDQTLLNALCVASLRGVQVDILIPERADVRLVQWATQASLWQVQESGCRVWLTPPPFDHSKLMTVDGGWGLIGSANWDARSLRLNFEFNVEVYDPTFVAELDRQVSARLAAARAIHRSDLARRRLPVKLRDGFARLLTPVL